MVNISYLLYHLDEPFPSVSPTSCEENTPKAIYENRTEAPDAEPGSYFGSSVSIWNRFAVIGAPWAIGETAVGLTQMYFSILNCKGLVM